MLLVPPWPFAVCPRSSLGKQKRWVGGAGKGPNHPRLKTQGKDGFIAGSSASDSLTLQGPQENREELSSPHWVVTASNWFALKQSLIKHFSSHSDRSNRNHGISVILSCCWVPLESSMENFFFSSSFASLKKNNNRQLSVTTEIQLCFFGLIWGLLLQTGLAPWSHSSAPSS